MVDDCRRVRWVTKDGYCKQLQGNLLVIAEGGKCWGDGRGCVESL